MNTETTKSPYDNAVIHVTQEDIDKGCRASSYGCPVARAILREFRLKAHSVSVDIGNIYIFANDGASFAYTPPEIVNRFINDFDEGMKTVYPFEFVLPPTKRIINRGVIDA